jgi:hypothetical protein
MYFPNAQKKNNKTIISHAKSYKRNGYWQWTGLTIDQSKTRLPDVDHTSTDEEFWNLSEEDWIRKRFHIFICFLFKLLFSNYLFCFHL